jgi:hypothetical protein
VPHPRSRALNQPMHHGFRDSECIFQVSFQELTSGRHRIRLTVGEPPTCLGCGSILHPALSRTVQEIDDPHDAWIKKLDSARLDKNSASFVCGRADQVGSAAAPFRDSLAALETAVEERKDVTLQSLFNERWVGARQPEPTRYDPVEPLTSGAGSQRTQTASRLQVPAGTDTDTHSQQSGQSGPTVREHLNRLRRHLSRHRGGEE